MFFSHEMLLKIGISYNIITMYVQKCLPVLHLFSNTAIWHIIEDIADVSKAFWPPGDARRGNITNLYDYFDLMLFYSAKLW